MDNLVLNKIGRCNFLTSQLFIKRLKEVGIALTIQEYAFLLRLNSLEEDQITQQKMATKLGKDKAVIMRLIIQLEKKRYVARLQDDSDKRKNNVVITKQGMFALDATLKIEKEISNKIETIFSELEYESLLQSLDKISMYLIKSEK